MHPASLKTLMDIRHACARPRTICASFAVSGMPSMSRLHVCVDLSLGLSGRLIVICFLSGFIFFTGCSVSKKCLVTPASAMASLLVFFIIGVY